MIITIDKNCLFAFDYVMKDNAIYMKSSQTSTYIPSRENLGI